jgi:hypothetical protein
MNLVSVRYTYNQLISFENRISDALNVTGLNEAAMVGLATDVNRVGVEMASAYRPFISSITAGVPADSVLVSFGPVSAGTRDSRHKYPPYRGGLDIAWAIPNDGGICTSGYDLIINSGSNAGLNQGSTAGHCGKAAVNEAVNGGQSYTVEIGFANTNSFGYGNGITYGDSVLIGMCNKLTCSQIATNILFINSTFTRSVTSEVRNFAQGVGAQVCMTGRTTGSRCGSISMAPPTTLNNVSYFNWYTGKYSLIQVRNQACVLAHSGAGDSGGPVYLITGSSTAGAVGSLSLGGVDGSGREIFCYEPMDNFTSDTGTRVRTS